MKAEDAAFFNYVLKLFVVQDFLARELYFFGLRIELYLVEVKVLCFFKHFRELCKGAALI